MNLLKHGKIRFHDMNEMDYDFAKTWSLKLISRQMNKQQKSLKKNWKKKWSSYSQQHIELKY